jgi:hypothetical protein
VLPNKGRAHCTDARARTTTAPMNAVVKFIKHYMCVRPYGGDDRHACAYEDRDLELQPLCTDLAPDGPPEAPPEAPPAECRATAHGATTGECPIAHEPGEVVLPVAGYTPVVVRVPPADRAAHPRRGVLRRARAALPSRASLLLGLHVDLLESHAWMLRANDPSGGAVSAFEHRDVLRSWTAVSDG